MNTAVRHFKISLIRRMCTPPSNAGDNMAHRYRPSNINKFILVWTKKYKSRSEVPEFVSLEIIERSRSEARIKLSNYLMVLTALGSIGAILSGKAAAKRGESVQQMNLDWHKKYDEEYEKSHKHDNK